MAERTGEKLGWTIGFLGALLWVPIVAVIAVARGDWVFGLVGLAIAAAGVALVVALAPWRRPGATYRRLMAPIYVVMAVALAWAAGRAGLSELGLSWRSALLLLPALLPLWIAGHRRWDDGAPRAR